MGLFRRRRTNRTDSFTNSQSTMIPQYTSPPARNTAEWMEAFGKNPRLAPIDKIAGDLSYAKGKLFRLDVDGTRTEITKHPFLDLMKNPNPLVEFTASALWKLFQEYLLLKGEAYFVIERYPDGMPAELWPVPVQWVQQTPYQGFPYYSIRTTGGMMMQVSVDDMFVMKDLNPVDPYRRGLGQAEAVADEAELDEYAAKFQKNFFWNGATPDTVVIIPGADEKALDRFRAKWNEKFKGFAKAHGLATLSGPREGVQPTVIKLADNMKDMDMVNGRTFTRDAIMEHFGVPREIMGITQNSNRATADAAQYIYARNVLKPRLMQRQDAINIQLLPYYGDDLVWEFDEIIPNDAERDKAIAMEGWQNSLLTRNASLELLGQETNEKGNIYKINFADMFVDENEDLVEISSHMANMQYTEGAAPLEEDRDQVEVLSDTPPAEEEEVILRKAMEIKARRIHTAARSLEAAKREQTRKFELAVFKYLRNQSGQIRSSLLGTQKAAGDIWEQLEMTQEEWEALSPEEQERLVMQFVNGLTDWGKEEEMLESILTPLWSETYKKGAEQAQTLYRLQGVQQPALVSTARLRGGQRITRVTQTTKDTIRQIIVTGLTEGKNKQTLTDEIVEAMNTSDTRARLIAAQECNTSLLAGNFDMAKNGGFQYKTWHITDPTKARDTHLKLNGKTVRIDEPFITVAGNKLMMPCDPDCNKAEETVNCHCFLTYS